MTTSTEVDVGRWRGFWGRTAARLFSVPILYKVMGIGVVVATLFGVVTYYQVRASVARSHMTALGRNTVAMATSLANRIERALVVDDRFEVRDLLKRTLLEDPDVLYLVVFQPSGAPVVTLMGEGVKGVRGVDAEALLSKKPILVSRTRSSGRILEATVPVLRGEAGYLRLGMSDRAVHDEVARVTRSFLTTLGLCVLVGQGLALALSVLLTQPIHTLQGAAERIARGDFSARAAVVSGDEIGSLTRSFNRMAEALEEQRQQIERREQARTHLLQRVISSQETERKRISRELHDQLGQILSGLLIRVSAEGTGGYRCLAHRKDLEQDLQEAIHQVRNMAWALRPTILDDYGLEVALERYVEECGRRGPVKLDYQAILNRAGDRVAPEVELALYRVAQEAVTNVLRHSGAHRASVLLLQRDRDLVLVVEDDGQGFDPGPLRAGDGAERLGLMGMEERVQLVGGVLHIESSPGAGTIVRVTVPLNREEPV